MNWDELAAQIATMTPEQRGTTVTIFVYGEYWGCDRLAFTTDDDVLDKHHPFIVPQDED